MGTKIKVTEEQFVEAVQSGMSANDICEKFDITENTVRAYCRRYKVGTIGERRKKAVFDDEYIVEELKKGTDHGIIAEHFNVARGTLNHYIRENNLNPNGVRRKATCEEVIERELAKVKRAEPPKKPFKDVVKGQRVVDVSCLYGI